jgi:hypothetical protein
MFAPILLFVYSRLEHTSQTIAALQKNHHALDSDLIIYSDAPKNHNFIQSVSQVRAFISQVSGFKSVTINERQVNFGLAHSIIDGVTETLKYSNRVIVLEDDLVTAEFFLQHMNRALDLYSNDEEVVSIHGYLPPTTIPLPDTFFIRGADCWGWATWRRAWTIFNPDGKTLLAELQTRNLIKSFNLDGVYPFSRMLEDQIIGKNDSWAIRWHASAFLANKYTLHPGRSLVHNIGNDNSGTHCKETSKYDTTLTRTPIIISRINIDESLQGLAALKRFYSQHNRIHVRIRNVIRRYIKKFLNI